MKKSYLLLLPLLALILCGCPSHYASYTTFFPIWTEDASFVVKYNLRDKAYTDTINMQTKDSCLIVTTILNRSLAEEYKQLQIEIQRISGENPIYILPEAVNPKYLIDEEYQPGQKTNYISLFNDLFDQARFETDSAAYHEIIGGSDKDYIYNYVQKLLQTDPKSVIVINDNDKHVITSKKVEID